MDIIRIEVLYVSIVLLLVVSYSDGKSHLKKPDTKQPESKQLPIGQPEVKQLPIGQPEVKQLPIEQPEVKQLPIKQPAVEQLSIEQPEVIKIPIERTVSKEPLIEQPVISQQIINPAAKIPPQPQCNKTCTGTCAADPRNCFEMHKEMPYTDNKPPKAMIPFKAMTCCDGETCCADCDIMCTKMDGECYDLHKYECNTDNQVMAERGICDRCGAGPHQECCKIGKKVSTVSKLTA